MSRKQTLIIYPHLVCGDGSLDRAWFVEWKYRLPGDPEQRKERWYKGLNKGTAEQRMAIAEKVMAEKREWLESGAYLKGNKTRAYIDELQYQHETALYGNAKKDIITIRTHLSDFLAFKKEMVNRKTLECYKSKLRRFNDYLQTVKLNDVRIDKITRQHIINFAVWLSKMGLSRASIKKYMQNLHEFFNYEIDNNVIGSNPVERIPLVGKIVDQSAFPLGLDDRQRLKRAIEHKDPQLWLACEIQYYCAIRPGTELRLMKIGWIDFDRKKIRIPIDEAKSNRVDLVDIPDFLIKNMQNMQLQNYHRNLYVFGKFGVPGPEALGHNTLRNRFNKYRNELGISPEHKFYSWKHTGAIQLLDNGVKPYDLKTHLRHVSFATTEEYIKKRAGNTENTVTKFTSEI